MKGHKGRVELNDLQTGGTNGSTKQTAVEHLQGATMSFHNIHYKVQKINLPWRKSPGKDILIDLKFLDVLAARKDPVGLSGEDDVVMGTLTVRENFTFSAALRLPTSVPLKEKQRRVDTLINQLGLQKVADSKVGTQLIRGVSGGERKRTNIGMELITNPPVLFLDEPTTGLDASTANSVYHGPGQNTLKYFSDIGYTCEPHNNPADFFLDIINGDAISASAINTDPEESEPGSPSRLVEEVLVEEYRSSSLYKDTKTELERITQGRSAAKVPVSSRTITYTTGFLTQFRWVLHRTFKNLLLNPQTSIAQVAVTLFLALIVGVIFFDVNKDPQNGVQN
ncbi:hypothetical protein CRUP_015172, partial [Coryphaenoides rupestris]